MSVLLKICTTHNAEESHGSQRSDKGKLVFNASVVVARLWRNKKRLTLQRPHIKKKILLNKYLRSKVIEK